MEGGSIPCTVNLQGRVHLVLVLDEQNPEELEVDISSKWTQREKVLLESLIKSIIRQQCEQEILLFLPVRVIQQSSSEFNLFS